MTNYTNKNLRICVICHLHYEFMWDEIKSYLHNLELYTNFDLYITLSKTNKILVNNIKSEFKKTININIEYIENNFYGADIYPFFHILNKINLNQYDIVYKLHTKQNFDTLKIKFPKRFNNGIYVGLSYWRKFLLNAILGRNNTIKVLNAFKNKFIGCAGFYPLQIHLNIPDFQIPKELSDCVNYELIKNKNFSKFYGGTIFAIRSSLLIKLQNKITYENFLTKTDSSNKFGDIAYFMEAFFGHIVIANNYKFYSTYNFVHKIILKLLSNNFSKKLYCFYVNKFILDKIGGSNEK